MFDLRLTTHINFLRQQLALPRECIAINAGAWGPLCKAAVEAMNAFEYTTQKERIDWMEFAPKVLALLKQNRDAVASLIGAKAEEIALCESTTQALNIVLWGLELQSGEEIISTNLENPAAEIVLWNLARRNGVRMLKADLGMGEIDIVAAFEARLSKRTRAFLVSDINYATGARCDLRALSELAHAHDVFLLVDGVQAVGTVPINVFELGVDAYALAGHKFLCGPDGNGALYICDRKLNQVGLTFSGVCSTTLYDDSISPASIYELKSTAERYEVSTRAFTPYVGGQRALKWLMEEVTLPFVYNRTSYLRRNLWDKLSEIPAVELISKRHWHGGLLAFRIRNTCPESIVETLRSKQIYSRVINIKQDSFVRLSIGFWNRESDIELIAEAINGVEPRYARNRTSV